jgi:hypothetical protein
MNDLKEMKQKNEIEKQGLMDIKDVKMNASLPHEERVEHFFNVIGNPYNFMCGDVPVIVKFSDNGESLSMKLERYFIRNKG